MRGRGGVTDGGYLVGGGRPPGADSKPGVHRPYRVAALPAGQDSLLAFAEAQDAAAQAGGKLTVLRFNSDTRRT